jgi:hypothetical protein
MTTTTTNYLTAMRALGRTMTYSAGVARALDSIPAAVLLSQLVWSSTTNDFGRTPRDVDEEGWFSYRLPDLEDHLSLGSKQLRSARALLEERSIIETKQFGMPAQLYWRLVPAGIEALFGSLVVPKRQPFSVSKTADHEMPKRQTAGAKTATHTFSKTVEDQEEDAAQERPMLPQQQTKQDASQSTMFPKAVVTPDQVLRGEHDGTSLALTGKHAAAAQAIADALLQEWARVWGKARAQMTVERRKVWSRWAGEQRRPSDILRAIRGMAYDESPADRSIHNDWPLVARNFDAWVALFNSRTTAGAKPVWPKKSSPPGCREWRGIWIPRDHVPDRIDEDRLAEGKQVFIIDDRNWADPTLRVGRERIAAQAARYGADINQPARKT